MSKSLYAKKVNRNIKKLNAQLLHDVFGNRFWARQVQKARGVDGIEYFLYELCDREQPERNMLLHWNNYWEICSSYKVWEEMNNFIITSDFWTKYWEKKEK
jgi:hypothetical protein